MTAPLQVILLCVLMGSLISILTIGAVFAGVAMFDGHSPQEAALLEAVRMFLHDPVVVDLDIAEGGGPIREHRKRLRRCVRAIEINKAKASK